MLVTGLEPSMIVYTYNNKVIDITQPIVYKGNQYNNLLDPKLRELVGILEVPIEYPEDYDEELYLQDNLADPPFVVFSKKPPEEVAAILLSRAKIARNNAVNNLKVTTTLGNVFDADETSQNRMSRAITGMTDQDTLPWVLADNSILQVSKTELLEALKLAGIAMATEWLKPYQ